VGCPARVLVVDDAQPSRSAIRALLTHRGYEVVGEAESAASAIDAVERLAPDALLLNVHLSDGDGFELTARLTAAHPRLAVILTSADFESSFYRRAAEAGARTFVPKAELITLDFAAFWR